MGEWTNIQHINIVMFQPFGHQDIQLCTCKLAFKIPTKSIPTKVFILPSSHAIDHHRRVETSKDRWVKLKPRELETAQWFDTLRIVATKLLPLLPKSRAAVDPTGSHDQQVVVDSWNAVKLQWTYANANINSASAGFLAKSGLCLSASSLSDTQCGQKIFLTDLKHVRTIKAGSIQNSFGMIERYAVLTLCWNVGLRKPCWGLSTVNKPAYIHHLNMFEQICTDSNEAEDMDIRILQCSLEASREPTGA